CFRERLPLAWRVYQRVEGARMSASSRPMAVTTFSAYMHLADQAGQHKQRQTDREQVSLPPLPTHRRRDETDQREDEDDRAQTHWPIVQAWLVNVLREPRLQALEGGSGPPAFRPS